jgi:hypothetical protein
MASSSARAPEASTACYECSVRVALAVLVCASLCASAALAERPTAPPVERPRAERAACSFAEPVCVHAARGATPAGVARALATAERTLALLRALRMPRPLPDGGRGGSDALDLYLGRELPLATHAEAIPATVAFARASAFSTLPEGPDGPACAFESGVARAVAEAMILGIDAAESPGLLAAQGSWLAELAAPCPALALVAIDRYQRRPDRALLAPSDGGLAGAMVLPWFLDDAYGTGGRGGVLHALIALTAEEAEPAAAVYQNEPDVFDALRDVMPAREKTLGELQLEVAVARAFMGDRSDGAHLIDSEWLGPLGRVRFEWTIAFSELPKRVAPAYPLEPSGAGYVWLDLAGATAATELTFVADWEETNVFEWALVRVDAEGRELSRQITGGVFGENQATLSLRDLGDAAAILVVGTNVGSDDRSRPYDPDVGTPRPAGYQVTFHPQ